MEAGECEQGNVSRGTGSTVVSSCASSPSTPCTPARRNSRRSIYRSTNLYIGLHISLRLAPVLMSKHISTNESVHMSTHMYIHVRAFPWLPAADSERVGFIDPHKYPSVLKKTQKMLSDHRQTDSTDMRPTVHTNMPCGTGPLMLVRARVFAYVHAQWMRTGSRLQECARRR